MSEYQKQAEEFLTECGATLQIEFAGLAVNREWKETTPRNHYNATITTKRGKMSVLFWDSINNTQKKKKPTSYDILACMQKYDCGTFEEFCSEFGYDEDSRTAERVYIACVREFKQLERIFTPEQLEKLREIN